MSQFNAKNILIITYARAINYGSALQAFALNKFLRDNGYNVKTIDYTTVSQQNLYRIFEPLNGMMSIFRNIQSLLHYRNLKRHKARFDHFIKTYIPMTKCVSKPEDLDTFSSVADYYICGSDQIWNGQCDDFDDNYMLSFVTDKSKCVAYSPSLGAGGNSKCTIDALKRYIKEFRALSCRENDGAKIISTVTGRQVETTADPVLLISDKEWNDIAKNKIFDGDYILGYFIGDRSGMRDFAKQMSKSSGLPVVVIYKNLRDMKYGFKTKYDCGPAEFVSLVKHAKGIVTNSFHAVAFSLIFKKDFWVFTNNSDSRITSILDLAGLKHRIVKGKQFDINDYLKHINYEDLDMSQLNTYIESSKEYLNRNLC